MNTNGNIYTVVYTAIIVIAVAAVLAFASQRLKPLQDANEKAETISQILNAAQFEFDASSNDAILAFYKENISCAMLLDAGGETVGELNTEEAEIVGLSELKAQNANIKNGADYAIPIYFFKNGVKVVPIYGAGLWGPVWGYIALAPQGSEIVGAYFDHASETPGLGGKIKDDPAFRGQFAGKSVDYADAAYILGIVKGGAPEGKANAVDAISGATMTSKGLDEAINVWLRAYAGFLNQQVEE